MGRFFVWASNENRSEYVELSANRPLLVGRGPDVGLRIHDDAVALKHLTLVLRGDGVVLEELIGAVGTTLNDVQILKQATLRPGDEIRIGQTRLVLSAESEWPVSPNPRLASFDELSARLEDELLRGPHHRQLGLVMVALPHLNASARQAMIRRLVEGTSKLKAVACWGEFSPDILAAVVPDEAPRDVDSALRAKFDSLLSKMVGLAGARARSAHVIFPDEAASSAALFERGLEKLAALEDVDSVVVDPTSVRLFEAAARLAQTPTQVVLVGSEGCGRTHLGRAFASFAQAPWRELSGATLQRNASVPSLSERELLMVRDADRADPAQLATLAAMAESKGAWLLATSQVVLPSRHVIKVPSLVDRSSEILPLAESFLAAQRRVLNRPRLSLAPEARSALSGYRWPGNVRELKITMARAARVAVRDELGRDSLPARLSAEAKPEDLRVTLEATERELLLDALARTRWNVTAAAHRLKLPRRTVVYRMSRLGLKRPAR